MTQLFTNSLKTADEISHSEKVFFLQFSEMVKLVKGGSDIPKLAPYFQIRKKHTKVKALRGEGFTRGETHRGGWFTQSEST